MLVLLATVALAEELSLLVAAAPLAPRSAALTELEELKYLLLFSASTTTAFAPMFLVMAGSPASSALTVEVSLVDDSDALPDTSPPAPARLIASFWSAPVAVTFRFPVMDVVGPAANRASVVTLEDVEDS